MGKTEKLLQQIVDNQNRDSSAYRSSYLRSCNESDKARAEARAKFDSALKYLPGKVTVAYFLWIPSIFGLGGLHRFYTRRWRTALVLLLAGLFTRSWIHSAIHSDGLSSFGYWCIGLLLGAFFSVLSLYDLFVIPRHVEEYFGERRSAELLKHIQQPSSPAPNVSMKRSVPDLLPAPRSQVSSKRIVKLARNRGSRGFTINDAVIELDVSPDEIRPELEKLMEQDLIESFKGPEGRILYRELSERYVPDSRPAPQPAPRPQALSKRILILARDRGPQGFSINDAVVELDVSVEKIRPALENLMEQNLIECFNGPEGRILYKEFGYVS